MNKQNMRGNHSFDSSQHAKRLRKTKKGENILSTVSSIAFLRQRIVKILKIIDTNVVSSYGKFIPAAVFLSSMTVMGTMSKSQMDAEIQMIRGDQAEQTQKLRRGIEGTLANYSQLLYDTRGTFSTKSPMKREEFHQFLDAIQFTERFPSIQAFSYSILVPGTDYSQILADYNISVKEQDIPQTELSAPIIFTSQDTGVNARILGTDNFQESHRKAALEYSRDVNMPVLSRTIALRQIPESSSASTRNNKGFILSLPVYAPGDMTSVEQRRKNTIGWISLSFTIDALVLPHIGQEKIHGQVTIVDESDQDIPIFSSDRIETVTQWGLNPTNITTSAKLRIGNKVWNILQSDTKTLTDLYAHVRTRPTLIYGLQTSLLFAFFSWLLIRNRSKIVKSFKEVSQASIALETAKKQYMALFRESGVPMLLVAPETGKIVDANNQACEFYGFSSSTFQNYPIAQFSGDENESILQTLRLAHIESAGVHEFKQRMLDGTIKDVHITTTFIEHNGATHILAIIQDITQRNLALQEKMHNLNHDALTGLPNRRLLMDRLSLAIASAERHDQKLGVLFIDLDNFKNINDSQGHAAGDILLKQASARMKQILRGCDTLARQGGDEFIVLLPSIHGKEDLKRIANKIIFEIIKPFSIHSREVFIGASIGGSIYPDDTTEAADLLQFADMAMYAAKTNGKSIFGHYQQEYGVQVRETQELASELHHALEKKELEVYYQPIIDVGTGNIYELEALARWNSPKFGMVPPMKFIPIAEDLGLIVEIGEWIMMSACLQVKQLLASGHKGIRCAVNISARQFRSKHLLPSIQSALAKTGIPPGLLTIELTESILVKDMNEVIRTLKEIADLGIQISIDDFGTGYSSLSYLREFPINILKIDKSFVVDIETKKASLNVMKGIVSLAHGLGMKVIVEGVDHPLHQAILIEIGCDYLQGYGLSHPMSPNHPNFQAMLTTQFLKKH